MPSAHKALQQFLDRLLLASSLTEAERTAVMDLPFQMTDVGPRVDLVQPGDVVSSSLLVVRGLLARYDLMSDGARQFTAFHIPGDMCDLHSVAAPSVGWGISTTTASTVLHIPHGALRAAALKYPALAMAMWRDTVLDASILAKWIANVGRKVGAKRIAHLLCEMAIRNERAGLGTRSSFDFPATQEQVGDAMGLTPVHVNRSLKLLRDHSLVEVHGRTVQISDWEGLSGFADFTPTFLLQIDQRAPLTRQLVH